MRILLMYRDRDFDLWHGLPWNEEALIQDLELDTLFRAMALGDNLLYQVAKTAILCGSTDVDTIRYRQDILRDCLANPAIVRDMYRIAIESIERKKKRWLGIFSRSPSGILYSSAEMLQMFLSLLRQLRQIADEHASTFQSEGWTAFLRMIQTELDDEYFAAVERHLEALKFRDGILLSVGLGPGNEGAGYILGNPQNGKNWIQRVLMPGSSVYSFRIHRRDDHGARALGELKDRGLDTVANALAQSADHIDSFFQLLRTELAFYVSCLNLSEQLAELRAPICFPMPVPSDERSHSFRGLYDPCLALTVKRKVVGNDVSADNKDLVVITGANQGGKSTFLRSIGLAQLMTQCGMFAPAESLCTNICEGLFTHYRRREDAAMESGKLDEELGRMSDIVDRITPNSTVLFNESFAATNEREGSEIARQIVSALLDKHIKVFFVTHQYELARSYCQQDMDNAIFLRAERRSDGTRTFRLIQGGPLQTSYGRDLYKKIFGAGHG
ncbi:MAG: DNA mismatch repair protein MutS [Anaerolineae bacterium]|nr:DNA mismatch repair protein MutS [Anaerolineae bacterium]